MPSTAPPPIPIVGRPLVEFEVLLLELELVELEFDDVEELELFGVGVGVDELELELFEEFESLLLELDD